MGRGFGSERAAHLDADPLERAKVLAAIRTCRCAHADERQLGAVDSCRHVVRHFDSAARDDFSHQFPYADLDDGRPPVAQHRELAGVDIHANHVVTIASETSGGHRPHVAQTEDADPHRSMPPLMVTMSNGGFRCRQQLRTAPKTGVFADWEMLDSRFAQGECRRGVVDFDPNAFRSAHSPEGLTITSLTPASSSKVTRRRRNGSVAESLKPASDVRPQV